MTILKKTSELDESFVNKRKRLYIKKVNKIDILNQI